MQIKISGPTVLLNAELKYPNQWYGSLGPYNRLMTAIFHCVIYILYCRHLLCLKNENEKHIYLRGIRT